MAQARVRLNPAPKAASSSSEIALDFKKRIEKRWNEAVDSIIDVGKLLVEAKSKLGHLRQISTGCLPITAEDPARPHAGEAAGNQGGAAAKNASAYPVAGTLVEASRCRPLRLLCRAHKQSSALSVPTLRGRPLAPHASAAQPEGRLHVGPHDEPGRRLASRAAHPSSMARPALRR